MSLRGIQAKQAAALAGIKVIKKGIDFNAKSIGPKLKNTIKAIREEQMENIVEAAEIANQHSYDQLETTARRILARYGAKDAPRVLPDGSVFPRRNYRYRTGTLQGGGIRYEVRRSEAKTLKSGNTFSATLRLHANTVAPHPDRPWPDYLEYPVYPGLNDPNGQGGLGQGNDVFSMIEYGTKYMRFSSQPYETFEGVKFSETRGFFTLDRIVKDEFAKLTPRFEHDLDEQFKIFKGK